MGEFVVDGRLRRTGDDELARARPLVADEPPGHDDADQAGAGSASWAVRPGV